MPDSLLSTKLNSPRIRKRLVHRPRLVDKMKGGRRCKLTVVSAPAGYGKTTAVAQWLAGTPADESARHSAWLFLDEADNELPRFFAYLIAALQKLDPAVGVEIQSILVTGGDVPIESLLTALVNDIASSEAVSLARQPFVLCLDDYHLITEFKIHEALDFLIDHIPPRMQLIIIGRTDPPMPLGRLRVQGELAEIREIDLQFTIEETTTFLNDLMGFNLSIDDIENLETRTEGWIAGLQLAALTLQGRQDQGDRVNVIAGSHRYLIDYLAHEVMSRQTEEVQSFLMRTSVLERFNAPLCETMIGSDSEDWASPTSGARSILEYMENANLFLVPLDDEHRWYRYHHLFRDFLRQQLMETRPEINPILSVQASKWYEEQGMIDEAISLAMAGGDAVRSARLLDENVETYIFNAEILKIIRWANEIPAEARARFPRLCIYHAWALQFELHLDSVEPALALAEAHLPNPERRSENFSKHQLLAHAKTIRAYAAVRRKDPLQAIALSKSALEEMPKEESEELATAAGAAWLGLGMAYQELGRVEESYKAYIRAMPLNQLAGNQYGTLSCMTQLMQVNAVRGKLSQAAAEGKRGLLWIEEWSKADEIQRLPVRMQAFFRLLLSEIQYERNDLDGALTNLRKAYSYYNLVKSWHRFVCQTIFVEIHQALGDVERALEWLYKLQRIGRSSDFPLRGIPLAAWIAERSLLLSQDRSDLDELFAGALNWADVSGLDPEDDFTGEQEYEYVTLARVMIANNREERAIPLLDRMSQSAERTRRWGDLIGILLLQAIAHKNQGNMAIAFNRLARALFIAKPEGYMRSFVDLGPPMRELLQQGLVKGISAAYIEKLLAAFPGRESTTASLLPSPQDLLIEPLNDREMQILRLMSARLSNREIAEDLYLSVNTIKWYARSIYEKLGVSSRRDAASKASELGLLSDRSY